MYQAAEISDRLREFSTQDGVLKFLRESAEKDESARLEHYCAVLGILAPDSLDKFLDIKYNKPEVTILSEKHICESCQGVVEQFRAMYPNAKVNIVSGKIGYNGDTAGKKTWTHRKKVK